MRQRARFDDPGVAAILWSGKDLFRLRERYLMRDGAVLINTARGTLVDTDALTKHLVDGRLSAVLDVTDPELLSPDSALYDLPNVVLTPHVAGSHGNELARLGQTAVAELERLTTGRPLLHEVRRTELERQA